MEQIVTIIILVFSAALVVRMTVVVMLIKKGVYMRNFKARNRITDQIDVIEQSSSALTDAEVALFEKNRIVLHLLDLAESARTSPDPDAVDHARSRLAVYEERLRELDAIAETAHRREPA
ncbi:hypothetical protein LG943_04850 [Streptomonospora sp. S1-112]|uniref:Uncharacterized protein n=1 Tax=Streptomonospora mangrovi TaxID=2883123 RepID=A0A9X3NHC8_9ACTN|nr:hypothetical protein [Streptomonospora mangrovi]MDA0563662.1 hypothetical protein [Streptomonospora mangrovi]